jgi:hypothetical protein
MGSRWFIPPNVIFAIEVFEIMPKLSLKTCNTVLLVYFSIAM